MAIFDEDLHAALQRLRDPESPADRTGRGLESVVAAAIESIPGVSVHARNAKSVFENEEIDIVASNRAVDKGLPSLPPYFSVECKNWSRPVGSAELSWFATKLRRSGQTFGVLVAAKGVSGTNAARTAAHFEVAAALAEGQRVVVLTLDELGWMRSGEELAWLLVEKLMHLIGRREIYVADERPVTAVLHPPALQAREARNAVLLRLSDEETRLATPTLSVAVGEYREALAAFLESELAEPSVGGVDDAGFAAWSNANMEAFELVERRLAVLGRSCIRTMRSRLGMDWPYEQLVHGLDHRALSNLFADPESELAEVLMDQWIKQVLTGPPHEHDSALLQILGWTIGVLDAIESGGWPVPSL
jgi:hypothetical protein